MTKIKCPRQSCNKEFEKPILVTNFVFTPTKETYPACPYCLSRIDGDAKTRICECTTVVKPADETDPQKEATIHPEKTYPKANSFGTVGLEKIGDLEKMKAELIAEVEELKQGATKKICKLEQEVAALKEEKDLLEQLTN